MRSSRIAALGAGLTLALTLTACAGEGAGGGGGGGADDGELTAGVAMPTETYERWVADGRNIEQGLLDSGYDDVDLVYANDDIPTQAQQIDQMINAGVDVLIIASIDGSALSQQLEAAEEAGIPVIAYDRLLRDSAAVDFYVTFDNYQVGVAQATSLLQGLGLVDENGERLQDAPEGPFNVELFAGALDDNNSHFFWDGAMDTLQPYLEDGTLQVPSGQTDIEQAATERWEGPTAQARMETLLTSTYNDGTEVDGVLAPADPLSRGIINALRSAGYGQTIEDGLPVVTGQDAEIGSVKLIADGVQYSTIFKDTRDLADQAVTAAEAFMNDEEPEANNTEDYDNGEIVVPSYLLEITTVTRDNIQEALVESEYYTEEQVESGQL
ncbi:multiple monosaccharide ABC transporter substrate-binding protein [Georgenia alba]|uniref:Multiple monosaccharide ABC transporter substrate-binding protein n=1 Tax=Georgenia alba TaxID=2233858 RepID=A0ABW2QDB4_9MICO